MKATTESSHSYILPSSSDTYSHQKCFEALEVEEVEPLQPARQQKVRKPSSLTKSKTKKNQKWKQPSTPAHEVERPPTEQESLTCMIQHVERPHKSS